MVVKTRKQGNPITITIPSEFNIPSGVKYEARLLPSGEIIFTPEELDHQVSYVSDDAFDLKLDTIFDEYDDVFKAYLCAAGDWHTAKYQCDQDLCL